MERIIGIHYGHDANVSIVEDGKVGDASWQLAVTQVEEHIGSQLERRIALRAIADNMPDDMPDSSALKDQLENRMY